MGINAWWKEEPYASIIGDVAKGKGAAVATGPGPDGKVNPQRQAPVGIMDTAQGSKMLHEGEIQMTTDDGRFAVIPSHVLPAHVLQMMEKQTKMGGFSSGGTGNVLTEPVVNLTNKTFNNSNNTPNPIPTLSSGTLSTNNPIIQNTPNPIQGTLAPTQQSGGTSSTLNIPSILPIGSTGTTATPSQPGAQQTTPQADINTSMDIARQYASGKPSPAANQAEQNQGAAAAAGAAALAQKGAMSGLTPQQQATEAAVYQRDTTNANAQLEGTLAAQAQTNQLNAAVTLNQEAVAQDNTNYSRQTDAANAAFNSGNIDQGVQILNELHPGLNLDATQLKATAAATQTSNNMATISTFASTYTGDPSDPSAVANLKTMLGTTTLTDSQISTLLQQDQANAAVPISNTVLQMEFPNMPNTPAAIAQLKSDIAQYGVSGGITYGPNGQITSLSTSMLQSMIKGDKNVFSWLGAGEQGALTSGTTSGVTAPNPTGLSYIGYDKTSNTYSFRALDGTITTQTPDELTVPGSIYTQLAAAAGVKPFVTEPGMDEDVKAAETYAASGHFTFTAGGNLWMGKGSYGTVDNGQNVTLDQNATVEGTNATQYSIPAGNYVGVTATYVRKDGTSAGLGDTTLLQSQSDPTKYYRTSAVNDLQPVYLAGYTYNVGGYYTKNS